MSPRTTIADIAAQAGVSIPTVSKVLNGRSDVAAATRARVESALASSGYRRRRAATPVVVPMVDLVFHELGSAWGVELIRGAEAAAQAAGAQIVVSECGGTHQVWQSWIDSVLVRRPAGVVLVFTELDDDQRAQLASRSVPYVVVDPVGEVSEGVAAVGSANWRGGRLAVAHLVAAGHRRVGIIGGPRDTLSSRMRVDGGLDALRSAGVAVDQSLVAWGLYRVEDGLRLGLSMLSRPDPPTGIFAGNDMQALGIYQAAGRLGLRIPDDVSVVGFDDLPLAEWVYPLLTTVRQPLFEMAREAVGMVLDLASERPGAARRIDLDVDLVERDSVAAPRRSGTAATAVDDPARQP